MPTLRTINRIFIRFCIYVTAMLLAYMVTRTIWSPDPLRPADVVIFVVHTKQGLVLTEVRKYVGFTTEDISTTRVLYHEANPDNYFVADAGGFRSLRGEFPVMSTYVLPEWVSGRWCSRVDLSWRPAWAQRTFLIVSKPSCFETTEYE